MKANVAIQILPAAPDDQEVVRIVDEVIDYIKSTGLYYYVGPCETAIEGDDLHQLMEIVENCMLVANRAGSDKISAYVKLGYNPGDVYLVLMKRSQSITSKLPAIGALTVLILLWLGATEGGGIPSFLLPSPAAVVQALVSDAPILLSNAAVTLAEAAWGLGIGIAAALVLATAMHRFRLLYRALYPILVITQTIPTIALAPLLVLWMGFGMAPKVTLVALTTFFPIAVSLLEGYASTDKAAADLLRSMGASRRQIFFHLEFPSALSHFFSGLRVSASYAVVGAVISEWLGGFEGLGVYMTRVKKAYAFDKMFAVILVIVAVSLLLMALVTALRRRACPWEAFEKIERND